MKKEVIYIDKLQDKEEKPVEFTHRLAICDGWESTKRKPSEFEKVVYLGNCGYDGDMFATYLNGEIHIYKGHLNSGRY